MSPSHVLFKMTIGIVLTFCCVPIIGYSQSGEIHGLIQALEDKNVNIRRRAIRELEKAGPSAVEPLIAALKSEKSRARAGAAEALGRIKDIMHEGNLYQKIFVANPQKGLPLNFPHRS